MEVGSGARAVAASLVAAVLLVDPAPAMRSPTADHSAAFPIRPVVNLVRPRAPSAAA